jgi:hypothetical protein
MVLPIAFRKLLNVPAHLWPHILPYEGLTKFFLNVFLLCLQIDADELVDRCVLAEEDMVADDGMSGEAHTVGPVVATRPR